VQNRFSHTRPPISFEILRSQDFRFNVFFLETIFSSLAFT